MSMFVRAFDEPELEAGNVDAEGVTLARVAALADGASARVDGKLFRVGFESVDRARPADLDDGSLQRRFASWLLLSATAQSGCHALHDGKHPVFSPSALGQRVDEHDGEREQAAEVADDQQDVEDDGHEPALRKRVEHRPASRSEEAGAPDAELGDLEVVFGGHIASLAGTTVFLRV
jgi:hypothetical protein